MATARKLPSGSWRVNQYIGKDTNGKRIYKSFTSSSKREAERMAAEYDAEHQSCDKSMTVYDAIYRYISSKDGVLSPTTISNYKIILNNNFQSIMQKRVDKITQEDVQNAVNDEAKRISAKGKPVSAKTIANAHGLLQTALKMFRPNLHLSTSLPRKQKVFKDFPTADQVIAAVKDTEIELPVLCGLWLGLRMSEIRGIKKSAISDGILTIDNVIVTVDGEPVEKKLTKTDATARKIKIPDIMIQMIDSIDGEYITNLSGQALYKRFTRIMDKHGFKGIRFHDLRHISASTMLVMGVPDKYAAERNGWATTHTMRNVYQHTFSSDREMIDQSVDEYYKKIYATQNATRNEENDGK